MNQKDECQTVEEPRPEFVTDEHLRFLDALRESGQTNMFGAAPYIADAFKIPMQQARKILTYWMCTFGTRNGKARSQTKSVSGSAPSEKINFEGSE